MAMSTSVKVNPLLVLADGIVLAYILRSTFENLLESINGTIEEIIDDGELIIGMEQEFQYYVGSNVTNASG
jgi:hypothetical protein